MLRLALAVQLLLAGSPPSAARRAVAPDTTPFARLVFQLSELGGFFDSDNLISNESSYLHILGRLRDKGPSGGAYIGVGPDQSFSYIAVTRPSIAFIIDIRRENLLLHLLFKAIFESSRNRLEYLCLLFGRPAPADLVPWSRKSIEEIIEYLDHSPSDSARGARSQEALFERVGRYGLGLAAEDFRTLQRLQQEFVTAGLDLRFTSYGRPPRPFYPTIRQLILEKDLTGRQGNFLVREEDFRFVQELQRRDRVIPVVGDLAGPHALKAIGRYLADRRERVSLFYVSNVEFYLFRQETFGRFVENVRGLPAAPGALLARSYFGGATGRPHPQAVPGYYSVQLLQSFASFLARTQKPDSVNYWDLVTEDAIEPN